MCVSVQASGVGIQMTLRLIAGIVGHTCGLGHCFHVYFVVHIFNHVVPVPMGLMENKREGVWGVLISTALFSTVLTFHLCPREFRLSSKAELVPLCKVISVKVCGCMRVCLCVCSEYTNTQTKLADKPVSPDYIS